ncbi:GTPase Der [Rhynchospora pubera]|uniref:GTPase Der n=1 Tax=Rhynchospora pubera TaxID=906938 RepID=A0AAV8FUE1_9POAL|nr:GTPase Der [Rhynchospora pubera]
MANPLLRPLFTRTRKTLLIPFTSFNFSKPISPIRFPLNPLKPPPSFDPSNSHLPSTWLIARFSTEALIHSSFSPSLIGDKDKLKGNKKSLKKSRFDFTKVDAKLLPTVILVGRPNVGKSALFNRLIKRREALVYNTPGDHVTRDIREGIAKLGDLRFRVLDSAGLETAATSGTILSRTVEMTGNVLSRSQFAIFLIDVRDGLQPLDLEVGKWLRKHVPGIRTIVAMNKSESLDEQGLLAAAAGEAHKLGFGDAVAISAETGLGMAELYGILRPILEDYMLQLPTEEKKKDEDSVDCEMDCGEENLPLQLAIVGRPNVGKSTLLNTLLQEERVLVGPEAGLTRDSIRAQFQFDNRTIYLVDTAGWLERSGKEKGPSSLSIVQSRKNLMRAHIVALVLDGEEIARKQNSMNHAEVVIARQAIEEGRGLVVIVNKMDLLRGKKNNSLIDKVLEIVPQEIQTVIPQVTGIPVVFISALEGKGRISVMHQVLGTYQKWCLRLPTARLNRWLRKVMSRHSWKDQATQPKIKYFTQVKARPPTFVAFLSGKAQLSDTDLRFLTKSLKEDFDLGGIPIRITQKSIPRKKPSIKTSKIKSNSSPRLGPRGVSDKRSHSSDVSF